VGKVEIVRLTAVLLVTALALAAASVADPAAVMGQQPMTVTVGLAGEVDSLDPIGSAVGSAVGYTIFEALFDTLVKVNPTNGSVQPGLASSWRVVDPQTYLFVLRRGIRFHNGEEFDAESAKFTLEHLLRVRTWLVSRIPFVERIEAVDRYTLRIRTSQPDVLLAAGLGDIPMYPRQYYQQVGGQGFATSPVGTGPFKFERWDRGVRIVLQRNGEYWGKRPQLGRIVFRPFVESATRLAALEAGEIDIAVNAPPDDAQRLRARGFRVEWTPIGQSMLVQFKLPANLPADSPLRHVKVRQALNHAVDKEALVRSVMLGFGKVLDGQIVGADAFGYNPALRPYVFDLQRARQLLSEAGYPGGFTIRMETSQGRYVKHREVSEALVGQLAQVGVRVQMDVLEWATFVGKLLRTLDIAPLSYVGWNYFPAMDSDFVLRHFATDSPFKLFSNPQFDELYRRQRAETDRGKRAEILRQAHAVLRDEVPGIFLFQAPNVFALHGRVQGFRPTPDDKIHFDDIVIGR
jgi:peptide/nickel transport system substrate-binding protein